MGTVAGDYDGVLAERGGQGIKKYDGVYSAFTVVFEPVFF
jgi:hypothetical protein